MLLLHSLSRNFLSVIAGGIVIFSSFENGFGKSEEVKPRISLRPVVVKNVACSQSGRYFAVPNCVTTGSVGVFKVSPSGAITPVPSRFSEKDFYRSRGVFYYSGQKDSLTDLAFIPLQEYTTDYSVAFSNQGDTLAICGGDKIFIYSSENWTREKTIDLKGVTRAVFSPDNQTVAAVADGKIYSLHSPDYTVLFTIEPENGNKFADVAFSNDGKKIAAFEYKNLVLDHSSRIRIFASDKGTEDRQLPWFTDKITAVPGNHFPLISFLPSDTALAVTLEKSLIGKVAIIKSNDGTLIKDFKGNCHALAHDRSLFAAGGAVYDLSTWKKTGKFNNNAYSATFDFSGLYLYTVASETVQRFKLLPD